MVTFFKTRGHVYRVDRKYIVLQIADKEELAKMNRLANRVDVKSQWLKINTDHAMVKDVRLLDYVKERSDLAGMKVVCSGIIKKYKFVTDDGNTMEGTTIIAKSLKEDL